MARRWTWSGADGTLSRFAISAVTQVKKTAFPTATVSGATPTRTLGLITCTGAFNPYSHHYVDSLIVWAVQSPKPE
jgi:hypothetical protein